jgi:hypothetical protein
MKSGVSWYIANEKTQVFRIRYLIAGESDFKFFIYEWNAAAFELIADLRTSLVVDDTWKPKYL